MREAGVTDELGDDENFLRVLGAAVFELGTDAFFVVDPETLRLIQVNRAFTRLFGYTNREARSLVLYDLCLSDRDEIDGLCRALATRGELMLGVRHYRRKDGVEMQLESRAGLTIVDGRTLFCVVSRDLSDLRRAERAAYESEQRFRTLADAAFEGIAITEGGRIIDGNQQLADLIGAPLSQLIGTRVSDFIAPEYREQMSERFRRGAGESMTHVALRADGNRFHVEAQAKEVVLGERTLRVTALRDISQRIKLEEQLRLAQRMESVGRLAGGVAHDFNNLLTVVLSLVDMLIEMPRPAAEREDLQQIQAAAHRAADLTRQLLAFARRQIVEPKVIDLNHLVETVEKLLRRLLGEHITLNVVCRPGLGAVRADAGQIEQVLMNLAINARDAMTAGGTLTIETANVTLGEDYVATHPEVSPGEYVMVAVSDTGAGMDQATLSRIFEPFFTTKPAAKGTGLGLATCYGIVKQSGGSLWVYSEIGRGTIFKVYLPRVREALSADEKRSSAAPKPGTETLLVVEDDAMVRQLALRVLTAQGYEVAAAVDPAEALAIFARFEGRVDALITDVVLPKMSGKELAERLRAQRPDLRVLFTSGYTENTIVHQGIVDDGVNFLAKPYLPSDLARRVRDLLDDA